MEFLVLRKRSNHAPEGMNRPAGAGRGDIEAVFQDLSRSDVHGLPRDENVVAAAEPMPLALLEPVGGEPFVPTADPASGDGEGTPTWGVRTVKADVSGFTGRGVRIAVLDTGIDRNHSAFNGVEIIGRNFTQRSSTDTTVDPEDFHDTNGHGTHCAGTIFGRTVGGNRIGIAPGIQNAIIGKVLGPGGGSTGTLFSAMNWAIEPGQSADIISMSLGMDVVGLRERLISEKKLHKREATSRAMQILVDNVRFFDKFGNLLRSGAAFGRSAVVIAATGNESDRFGKRFGGEPFVLGAAYPSDAEDFLAIGAIESTNDENSPFRIADFSNASADLAAPGVNVLSAAAGLDPKALRFDSGTSMATPHVAGVAALWAQKLMLSGRASSTQIANELMHSAQIPIGLESKDVGVGIPTAPLR